MSQVLLKTGQEQFYAFLIQSDEEAYYTCNLLCGQWLSYIGKKEYTKVMKCDIRYKEKYQLTTMPLTYEEEYKWIFAFPIKEEEAKHLYHISLYFELFMRKKNLPLTERITASLIPIEAFVPSQLLYKMISFCIEKKYESNEKLRLLLNNKIQNYLSIKKEEVL
jgi:hypothetical protein